MPLRAFEQDPECELSTIAGSGTLDVPADAGAGVEAWPGRIQDVPEAEAFAIGTLRSGGTASDADGAVTGRTTFDGIALDHILRDRPDVLNAYLTEISGPNNDPHSPAWLHRVGGTTPEDYADYWYRTYGHAAGYGRPEGAQSAAAEEPPFVRTTSDGIPLSKILHDRPDVFQAFFTEYYGPNNDRHSHAWVDRVGGSTPEDYARYWYEHGGRYGYSPSDGAAARSSVDPSVYAGGRTTSDGVYLDQILHDRPDVFQLFFTEYYGPNNDRHSTAWMDRVGGVTPQDYARYWYEHGGKYQYTPEPLKIDPPAPAPAAPEDDAGAGDPAGAIAGDLGADGEAAPPEGSLEEDDAVLVGLRADTALPDEPAWPGVIEPAAADTGEDPGAPMDADILLVGQTFIDPDPFVG